MPTVWSHAVQHNDRRAARQVVQRHLERSAAAEVNLEPLAHHGRELADRRRMTMHRQDDRRMQPVGDLTHVGERLRHAAVDRDHDNVEPADGRVVGVLQPMVQMAEMADAQACDFEDKDGIAVDLHGPAAADVGRHVADEDIVDGERMSCRSALRIPAAQDEFDPGVRNVGIMGAVGLVHGDDARQRSCTVVAAEIGGDPHAGRRFDHIGRMAGIGDGDRVLRR